MIGKNGESVKKILVIEDEPIIAKICSRVLSSEGFTVDVATNGLIALDMLKKSGYDVCISDIRIPEISGIELYRYIRNEQPNLIGNIIFISGDVLNNEVKHFLTDNSVNFLAKPFSPQELSDAVTNLIGAANAV